MIHIVYMMNYCILCVINITINMTNKSSCPGWLNVCFIFLCDRFFSIDRYFHFKDHVSTPGTPQGECFVVSFSVLTVVFIIQKTARPSQHYFREKLNYYPDPKTKKYVQHTQHTYTVITDTTSH